MRRSAIAAIVVLTAVVCGCFLFVAGCRGGGHTPTLRVIDVKHATKGSMPDWQPKRFSPTGLIFSSARHGWLFQKTSADSLSKTRMLETWDGGRRWSSLHKSEPRFQPVWSYDTSRLCRRRADPEAGAASFW